MSRSASLNEPSRWLSWLRACSRDEGNPIRLPGPLGMLTGQDCRALGAIAYCWHLYASSDEDGERGALAAVRALLPALQPKCRPFARELIAQALDWRDRERLWPLVLPQPEEPAAPPQAASEGLAADAGPNSLGKLRTRLDVTPDELARRLGIADADASTLEATPLRLLEVGDVERFVGALGCRLDVVAVHIDGFAVWLSDEEGAWS